MALSFAKAGAKALYLVARSQDGLDKTRELVLSINSDIKVFTKALSITDEDAVRELFLQIGSEYGKADVLINCAGIGSGGPFLTAPVANIWRDFVSIMLLFAKLQNADSMSLGSQCKRHHYYESVFRESIRQDP